MRKSIVVPVIVGLGILSGCGKGPAAVDATSAPVEVAAPATTAAPAPDVAALAPDVAAAPTADAAAPAPDAAAPAPDVAATTADIAAATADVAAPASDVAVATGTVADVAAAAEPEPPPAAWTLSPAVAVPAATATTGACVPELDAYADGFGYAHIEKRSLELCNYGDGDAITCYALDLDSGAVKSIKPPKAAKITSDSKPVFPKEIKVAPDAKSAKVCVDKKCVNLDLKGMTVDDAGLSAGRVFIAGGMSDAEGAEATTAVRVYDAVTGAELSSLTYGALESTCPIVSWAGEVLYVEEGVCAGPGAVGVFFDATTGKKLGLLGGTSESASAYAVTPIALANGLVAFREQYGNGIFFHDAKTGALTKRMNLSSALLKDESGEASTSPTEGWMHAATTADGKTELIVGNGSLSRKRVLVIDPEALTITRMFELTPCPR